MNRNFTAKEGMSLYDYVLAEIARRAQRPTTAELRERLRKRTRVIPETPPAEIVREGRDSRRSS